MSRAAVFLDRDGVLCQSTVIDGKPYAVRRVEDFRLLPGTVRAVEALRHAGFAIVVVTNQPDIGNGLVSRDVVEQMHRRLRQRIRPDAIELCPHRQDEGCACRKPKPGMLHAAAQRLGIDLSASFMVGDRWNDIVAGRQAGVYTVLIDRGYREGIAVDPDWVAHSLPAATAHILARGTVPGSVG
ncbi:MAG: HAD family hydrolase [Alphaproteobacteria bacterium]|nr:HAD family hydrolase [Alphaproteobacteria bacterium]